MPNAQHYLFCTLWNVLQLGREFVDDMFTCIDSTRYPHKTLMHVITLKYIHVREKQLPGMYARHAPYNPILHCAVIFSGKVPLACLKVYHVIKWIAKRVWGNTITIIETFVVVWVKPAAPFRCRKCIILFFSKRAWIDFDFKKQIHVLY